MNRRTRRWAGWIVAVGAGLGATMAAPAAVETREASVTAANAVMFAFELECRPETQILLLVDARGPEGKPDGRVDHLFRLQAESGDIDDGWVRVLHDVDVHWEAGQVEVWKEGAAEWSLTVPPIRGTATADRFEGFGLSHTSALEGLAMPDLDEAEPTRLTLEDQVLTELMQSGCGAGEWPCTSGGQGATECGVTCSGISCSVECDTSSGYWPCCGCHFEHPHPCCGCSGGPPAG